MRPWSRRRRSWRRPLYATSWVRACLNVYSSSGKRVDPKLGVVGLLGPGVLVLGPIIDEQRMRALGRLSTRPSRNVCVSESIQCSSSKTMTRDCPPALAQQQTLDGIESALPALGRIERLPLRVVGTSSRARNAG